jgi:hypothetical protein
MSDAKPAAKAKPAPDTRTPRRWAKHFELVPPDAAGTRVLGGWQLHDDTVTEAQYRAALKQWQGGDSHGRS